MVPFMKRPPPRVLARPPIAAPDRAIVDAGAAALKRSATVIARLEAALERASAAQDPEAGSEPAADCGDIEGQDPSPPDCRRRDREEQHRATTGLDDGQR